LIKFENVSFNYENGPDILKNINFTLAPGSYHFLSGPSGSGKTSLMSLLYLGHRPTSGRITMLSQDTKHMTREDFFSLRQKIGVVFQNYRLLNHLTAFDNVALPLRIQNKPEREIKSNVSELLDWVGLGDAQNSLPPTLSGGQQQRIAIARAVITRPKLLLADEPTGNLDSEMGYRLMRLFEQLNKMGTTTVIATHNQDIMERYKHSKLLLDNGSIYSNSKKDLLIKTIRDVY